MGVRGVPYPPIVLDRAANRPLYRQIEVAIRRSILDGRIGPGTVLPGIRAYAKHLGVAAVTVMTAYEQLTAEGYLEPRPGHGTLVAPGLPDVRRGPHLRAAAGARPRSRRSGRPARDGRSSAGRAASRGTTSAPARRASTCSRSPCGNACCPRAWRDLVSDPASATTYRYPEGDPRLRVELAAYLGLSRAVRTTPDAGGRDRRRPERDGDRGPAVARRRTQAGRGGPREPAPPAHLRGLRRARRPRPGRRPRPARRSPPGRARPPSWSRRPGSTRTAARCRSPGGCSCSPGRFATRP